MVALSRLVAAVCSNPQLYAMARKVSTTVRISDVAYFLHELSPTKPLEAGIPVFDGAQIAEQCTLLTVDDFPKEEKLRETFETFADLDDVWSADFLQCVIVQFTKGQQNLTDDQRAVLYSIGVQHLHSFHHVEGMAMLPQGPYFLDHGRIHQVYRLYPDTSGAFVVATVPTEDDGFRSLDASAYGEQYPSTLTVAVPSRLYSLGKGHKPYAGMRIGVKDIIDLKGLKTGASSRAYTELYPVKEKSATAVQQLIDLGFVVVGKLKPTQFADSEWPTCDWVDYHGPFNPRGDGYLTPSGSSAGSASAVASYEWLDFSLGTDTLASIRSPAAAQALFGMRPTLGAVDTSGMVPYSSNWDPIGGFARTAAEYKTLAQALYGSKDTEGKTYQNPTKLIYLTDYWKIDDEASGEVFEKFIVRLEQFLNIERTKLSLADTWNETRPEGTEESLGKQFHHTFDWSANRDQWTGLLKPFVDDYEREYGKPPVLNPQVRFKLDYTPTITAGQKAEGERQLKLYHDWFYEHVMDPSTDDGYSSTILVLPWTNGEPDYRDKYKDRPQRFTGQGFFFYNIGPYAQCPELILPVGSTPYESKFTGKVEQLPAAIGIIAAKGSDIMLADLVSKIWEDEGSLPSMDKLNMAKPDEL